MLKAPIRIDIRLLTSIRVYSGSKFHQKMHERKATGNHPCKQFFPRDIIMKSIVFIVIVKARNRVWDSKKKVFVKNIKFNDSFSIYIFTIVLVTALIQSFR